MEQIERVIVGKVLTISELIRRLTLSLTSYAQGVVVFFLYEQCQKPIDNAGSIRCLSAGQRYAKARLPTRPLALPGVGRRRHYSRGAGRSQRDHIRRAARD